METHNINTVEGSLAPEQVTCAPELEPVMAAVRALDKVSSEWAEQSKEERGFEQNLSLLVRGSKDGDALLVVFVGTFTTRDDRPEEISQREQEVVMALMEVLEARGMQVQTEMVPLPAVGSWMTPSDMDLRAN